MEITGKLIKKLDVETGESENGAWQKRQFIIETDDKYPKQICCMAWGDKVDDIKDVAIGSKVTVSINIESREYNQRWYTDVRMWKIVVENAPKSAQTATKQPEKKHDAEVGSPEDDLPF